jgi:hypothetical protein
MGHIVSKSNKDYINNNWDELKCSPIGPILQMFGIAPGNAKETSSSCKSSEFSSQFNSSMIEHINVTSKISGGLNEMSSTMNKFRSVLASMEQRAFNDISIVATKIFDIYIKIGNLYYVLTKQFINIASIFNAVINVGSSIAKLLLGYMDLYRVPINALLGLGDIITRKI